MDYKATVKEAWELTQQHKGLLWLGSISAFITTIVGLGYLIYQITSFQHSSLFGGKVNYTETFHNYWEIVQEHTFLSIIVISIAAIFFIANMFVPLIINGALIDLVKKAKEKRPLKGGVGKGMICLFPMVKFHAVMSPFSLFSILMEVSLVMRVSGIAVLYVLLPLFIIFYIVGFIMVILFSFADQYIILEEDSFTGAMGKSTKLVLIHFKETIFLILLMLLISARILINVILILFIPLAIVTLSGYLASVILAQIGIYIAIGVGILLLFLTSYFIGTLNVFTAAVWTLSYLKMREEELE